MTPASLAGTVGSKKSVEALVGKFSQPGAFSSMAVPTAQFAKEKPTTRKRKATPWEERQNAVYTITTKNKLNQAEDQRLVESYLYIHRKTDAGQRISPIASKAEAPAYQVTQDAINRAMRMSKTPEGRAKMAAEVAEFRAQRQFAAAGKASAPVRSAVAPAVIAPSKAGYLERTAASQAAAAERAESSFRTGTFAGRAMSSLEDAMNRINAAVEPVVRPAASAAARLSPLGMIPAVNKAVTDIAVQIPGGAALSIPQGIVDLMATVDPDSRLSPEKRLQTALGAVLNLGGSALGAATMADDVARVSSSLNNVIKRGGKVVETSPRLSNAQKLQARAATAEAPMAAAAQTARFTPTELPGYSAGTTPDLVAMARARQAPEPVAQPVQAPRPVEPPVTPARAPENAPILIKQTKVAPTGKGRTELARLSQNAPEGKVAVYMPYGPNGRGLYYVDKPEVAAAPSPKPKTTKRKLDAGEQIDILKSPRLRAQAEATAPRTAPEVPAQAQEVTVMPEEGILAGNGINPMVQAPQKASENWGNLGVGNSTIGDKLLDGIGGLSWKTQTAKQGKRSVKYYIIIDNESGLEVARGGTERSAIDGALTKIFGIGKIPSVAVQRDFDSAVVNGRKILADARDKSNKLPQQFQPAPKVAETPAQTAAQAAGRTRASQVADAPEGWDIQEKRYGADVKDDLKRLPKKFHRGDQAESLNATAAQAVAANEPRYMIATQGGFRIIKENPSSLNQSFFEVVPDADGFTIRRHKRVYPEGAPIPSRQETQSVSTPSPVSATGKVAEAGNTANAKRIDAFKKKYGVTVGDNVRVTTEDGTVIEGLLEHNPKRAKQGTEWTVGGKPIAPRTRLQVEPLQPSATQAKEPWQMTKDEYEVAHPPVVRQSIGAKSRIKSEVSIDMPRLARESGVKTVGFSAGKDGHHRIVFTFAGKGSTKWTPQDRASIIQALKNQGFLKVYDDGDGGIRVSNPLHIEVVQNAVEGGKPVPPEVLADYPDLIQVPSKVEPLAPKPLSETSPYLETPRDRMETAKRSSVSSMSEPAVASPAAPPAPPVSPKVETPAISEAPQPAKGVEGLAGAKVSQLEAREAELLKKIKSSQKGIKGKQADMTLLPGDEIELFLIRAAKMAYKLAVPIEDAIRRLLKSEARDADDLAEIAKALPGFSKAFEIDDLPKALRPLSEADVAQSSATVEGATGSATRLLDESRAERGKAPLPTRGLTDREMEFIANNNPNKIDAREAAERAIATDTAPTVEELLVMRRPHQEAKNKFYAAMEAGDAEEVKRLENLLDLYEKAGKIAGSKGYHAYGRAAQYVVAPDFSRAALRPRAKYLNNGEDVTPRMKAALDELGKKWEESQAALGRATSKYEEEIKKLQTEIEKLKKEKSDRAPGAERAARTRSYLTILQKFGWNVVGETNAGRVGGRASKKSGAASIPFDPKEAAAIKKAIRGLARDAIEDGAKSLDEILAHIKTKTPDATDDVLLSLLSDSYSRALVDANVARGRTMSMMNRIKEQAAIRKLNIPAKVLVQGWDILNNTQRSLMASIDASFAMIQGGKALQAGFVKEWLGSWKPALRAGFSRAGEAGDVIEAELQTRPHFAKSVKAGVQYTDMHGISSEEMFGSKTAEKVPGVARSNAAFNAFMNNLRYEMFSTLMARQTRRGRVVDEAYAKDAANLVNVLTGRGMGRASGVAGKLGDVFFAPKFMLSEAQDQALVPLLTAKTGAGRAQALRAYATRAATLVSVAYLADQIPGVDVDWDPRSDTNGYVRLPNGVIVDLWNKQSALTRVFVQIAAGRIKRDGGYYPFDPSRAGSFEEASRFLKNRLSPGAATLVKLADRSRYDFSEGERRLLIDDFKGLVDTAKDIIDNPTPAKIGMAGAAAGLSVAPLAVRDIVEIGNEKGPIDAVMAAPFILGGLRFGTTKRPTLDSRAQGIFKQKDQGIKGISEQGIRAFEPDVEGIRRIIKGIGNPEAQKKLKGKKPQVKKK